MHINPDLLIRWAPRIVGIAACLFLSLFALDAFEGEASFGQRLLGFLIHLTPTLILGAAVALSWRWPWIGAAVFTGAALLYMTLVQRLDWVAMVAGPLLLTAALFFWSWIRSRGHHAF